MRRTLRDMGRRQSSPEPVGNRLSPRTPPAAARKAPSRIRPLAICAILVAGLFAVGQVGARKGAIEGRLSTLHGDPVTGAEMTLYGYRYQGKAMVDFGPAATVQSGPGGQYRFEGLEPGYYMIRAWLEAFRISRVWDVHVSPGQTRLLDLGISLANLGESPPTVVAGAVRSAAGEDLAGAAVTLRDAFNAGVLHQARTDEKGRYSIELLFCGVYVVTAFKPGFDVEAGVVKSICGESTTLDLRLRKVPE